MAGLLSAHVAALLALAGDLDIGLHDGAGLDERLEQGRNGSGLDIQTSERDQLGGGLTLAVDHGEQGVADGLLLSLLLGSLLGNLHLAKLVGVVELGDGVEREVAQILREGLGVGDGVVELTVGHSSFLSRYLVATH